MGQELKGPRKGAGKRLRDFYNSVVRKPLSEKDKGELREIFEKEDPVKKERPTKIAKPERDVEL